MAAFLRRQASRGMVLEPTLTRNPPSNHTLTALRFSPVGVSGLLARLESEEPILFRKACACQTLPLCATGLRLLLCSVW